MTSNIRLDGRYGAFQATSVTCMCRERSGTPRPATRMTSRNLVGEVLEQLGPSHRRQEMGDDAESERVTADTGEVFSEQVGCSFRIASES